MLDENGQKTAYLPRIAEGFVSIAELARSLVVGEKTVSKAALNRWCVYGVGGVRLRHIRVSNKLYVNPVDIEPWLVESAAAQAEVLAARERVRMEQRRIRRDELGRTPARSAADVSGCMQRLKDRGLA
jgi:hypothetical protein